MADPKTIQTKLFDIAEPVVSGAGYELVDVRYLAERGHWIVRIYIDRPEGASAAGSIGFSDCEVVSRQLGAAFDVEDPVPHGYSLEVSSPGVDRPLRTLDHFRRFCGHHVKISLRKDSSPLTLSESKGRRRFTGTLAGVDATSDAIAVIADGTEVKLALSDIDRARLVPEWDIPASEKPVPAGRKERQ